MHPRSHLTARPEAYFENSFEEAQLILQYSYKAGREAPGVIDLITGSLKAGG